MNVTCLNQTVEAMTIPFTVSVAVQGEASPDLTQAFTDACRKIYTELKRIEADFSAFLPDSLVSRFAEGDESILLANAEFQEVYAAALLAKEETAGAFDPYFAGKFDPTGPAKGETAFKEQIAQRRLSGLYARKDGQLALFTEGDLQYVQKA
ncbi:FAD:protein FMN transferase [Lactobacillus delbrueckii]|uniref:FAD:protein FMN transferase n=1 Tax=Lactobacillus delbrueckii TaxID=1584 RepID=UPI001E3BA71C|nr:FAD:protein FMN transferase [Lactobacillus delbrueckii]MCD5535514.1 FAD:protein FMN transferase [Lactobacillus delbrueckii subsp. sunkii]